MSQTPLELWLLLGGLLCLSGFFSASETALFSLSPPQAARAGRRVRAMLARPRETLVTVPLCNLVVNLAFFAFASQVHIGEGESGRVASGFAALLAVLLVGEILPKSLALRAPVAVAEAGSWPLAGLVRLMAPVRRVIHALLEPLVRLASPRRRDGGEVTSETLGRVLERSAEDGLLETGEANLLAEIVELGGIRVREIMTARVDALMLEADADPAPIVAEALAKKLTWLPVYEESRDEVLGLVKLRELLAVEPRPVRQLVMPVKFVPEVARVLDLLNEFREDRAAEAVVVDEWGGTAGVVTIEDVFEEIVGELRVEGEEREKPVVPLGEGCFRVAGGLSIRDWNEEFGARVVPTEFETVGGFVTALLGRIPRAGDRVRSGELVCEVREVSGRRVLQVDMFIERRAHQGGEP
ncbi:MAG: hemolysin family protein [Planctomycetota bacterium]|jgi:CBS domain containing-hemolysin-like protein|nr:hemolysin family protein [Planctomycetota bacterium]MDP6764174.1 hemolysin family protein [Planctomycetota bacterium]MDP6989645.1 hemolysin family protein [Planctomycetota bacterium]